MTNCMNGLEQAAHEMMFEANALAEEFRVRKLAALGVLDTPPEPVFDDIVALAAHVCHTSSAMINFTDDHRTFIKSAYNAFLGNVPREHSLCSVAIQHPDRLLVVPDALADPEFATNPYIQDGICRFYAGMPLVTNDGFAVGSICVFDREPGDLSDAEGHALRALARVVMQVVLLSR